MSEQQPRQPQLNSFMVEMQALLDQGSAKGYDDVPMESSMKLQHAIGELLYKVYRFLRRRDPTDLVKAAAWAGIIWELHHDATKIDPRIQDSKAKTFFLPGGPRPLGVDPRD